MIGSLSQRISRIEKGLVKGEVVAFELEDGQVEATCGSKRKVYSTYDKEAILKDFNASSIIIFTGELED